MSLGGIVALCNVVCVLSMNPDSAWGFVPALGAAAAVGLGLRLQTVFSLQKGVWPQSLSP